MWNSREMAKGSEQFAWHRYPGAAHVCRECRKNLKVSDVADAHEYPEVSFLCTTCRDEKVQALVARSPAT